VPGHCAHGPPRHHAYHRFHPICSALWKKSTSCKVLQSQKDTQHALRWMSPKRATPILERMPLPGWMNQCRDLYLLIIPGNLKALYFCFDVAKCPGWCSYFCIFMSCKFIGSHTAV
jgi:hypothetical protein